MLRSETFSASRRPGRATAEKASASWQPGRAIAGQAPAPITRHHAAERGPTACSVSRGELIRAIVEQSTPQVTKTSRPSTLGRERRPSTVGRERRVSQASVASRVSSFSSAGNKMVASNSTASSIYTDAPGDEDEEVEEASSRVATLQKYMQIWQVQLLFFGACLVHCVCYLVGPGQECTLLEVTGGLVIGLTLLELLVRVAAQAGCPWWLSAWKRFLLPIFHVAEIFVVAALIARCGWAMHICPTSSADDRTDLGFDRPSLAVVLYHRAMRAWAIFYGVSVQSTQKHRHHKDCKEPAWWQDWEEERRKKTNCLSYRIAGFLGELRVQFCILLLVTAHCSLYSVCNVTQSKFAWLLSEPTGYLTFAVLAFEFIVRCSAQGGEQFFTPALHKVEVAFLGAASFVLLYPALYSAWIVEGRGGWQPYSSLVWVIVLTQRTVRFLATQHDRSAREWGLHSVLEAKAFKVFLSMFGDLLEVSPQNVRISLPSPTQKDIKVRITKAKLKPQALRHLHLPIAVRGGLVEALDVTLPRPLRGERHEDLVTRLTLKNLLLLVGPGGGLGEAGFGVFSRYWVSDNVMERKSKLVELICQKLSVFGYTQSTDADEQREGSAASRKAVHRLTAAQGGASWGERARLQFEMRLRAKLDSMKEKFTNLAQELALNNVEVSISNVRLEYEDLDEGLGYDHAMIGLRVGDIFIHRLLEQRLTVTASRLGVSVDVSRRNSEKSFTTQPSSLARRLWKKSSSNASSILTTRRKARGLCRIIGEHPQKVMDQMNVLNVGEKLRLWAFEALDPEPLQAADNPLSENARPLSDWQRHWRCERWPERHLIISLQRVSVQAGPSDGNGSWCRRISHISEGVRPKSRVSLWGDRPRKRKQKPWLYRAHLTPLRLAIDDEQARYLQTLFSCLKSWSLHDGSFRWRPDFMPLSPALCTEDELRQERSTIVRLWWMYALHRVLARRHKRPRVPTGLQVSWHVSNVNRYRDLMSEVARRPGAEVSQLASQSWTWSEWEKAWAKELQLRLRLVDIIEGRRFGLTSRSMGFDQKDRIDHHTLTSQVGEKLADVGHIFAQMNMEQITEVQQRVMEAAEMWQDRVEETVHAVGERMDSAQEIARHQVLDVHAVLDSRAKSALHRRPRLSVLNRRPRFSSAAVSSWGNAMLGAFTPSESPTSKAIATFHTSEISGTCDRPSSEDSPDASTSSPDGDNEEHEKENCNEQQSGSSSESSEEASVVEAAPDVVELERKVSHQSSHSFWTGNLISIAKSLKGRERTIFLQAVTRGTEDSSLGANSWGRLSEASAGLPGENALGGSSPNLLEPTFGIHNAAGCWKVTMSGAEVRILRHADLQNSSRAVLLHAKWGDITLDAYILPSNGSPKPADGEAGCTTQALNPYTATISISSFAITSPDADELLLGSGREILRVTKPVELPPAKPGHLNGSCTGQQVAIAARLGVTVSSEGELSSDIDVHVSDMFAVLSTPLLVVLQSYVIDVRHEQPQHNSQLNVILDAVAEEDKLHDDGVGKLKVQDISGGASVEQQRHFEMLTGMQQGIRSIFLSWSAEVNVGSCQIVQVSQYIEKMVLVEEYRIWPFSTSAIQEDRAEEDDEEAIEVTKIRSLRSVTSKLSHHPSVASRTSNALPLALTAAFHTGKVATRWITMESKGFENMNLLSWDDEDWLIEDTLDECAYNLSCKGKPSGNASGKETGVPYLQVQLKGGMTSVSSGPASRSPLRFSSYNDIRVVDPCFANLGNETANPATDDLQMPLHICGATASCSCMISARAPAFVHGHSPQSTQEASEMFGTPGELAELLPSTAHRQRTLMCDPGRLSSCGKQCCSAHAKSREVESDADETELGAVSMTQMCINAPVAVAAVVAPSPTWDLTQRTGVDMRLHILPCTGFGKSWIEHLAKTWCDEVYPPWLSSDKPGLKRTLSQDLEGSLEHSQRASPVLLRPSRRMSHSDFSVIPLPKPDVHDMEADENG